MEITDIKAKLSISQVLAHYNLKPDKQARLNCPFHEDKTPSMQLYWKTHTAFCFSSNCKLNGKSIDVIDFVMHKENSTKHEALKKCEAMISGEAPKTNRQSASDFLQKMFTYFKNAVYNSKPAQDYIKGRSLDYTKLEIGYNAAQFHHGIRKDETLINQCLQYGLLIDAGLTSKTGDKAYKVFGKHCIVFALRNKSNQITGLYFRSTVNETESKHYYLKERSGIYPHYPKPDTKKLILTESTIDAATLLQINTITVNYSIISAFGTNGLNEEIKKAIASLKELEEIVFAFDTDAAGKAAVEKYSKELNQLLPNIAISSVTVPLKDINETAQAHEDEAIFTQLLEERTFIFQLKEPIEKKKEPGETTVKPMPSEQAKLNTANPEQLIYETPNSQ